MALEQWRDGHARCFGMLLDGRAQETGIKRRGSDATMLLIYNAHYDVVNFTLPAVAEGQCWLGLIDTTQPAAQMPPVKFGHTCAVSGRSLMAFGLMAEDAAAQRLRNGVGAVLDIEKAPIQDYR
jgi:isoamylase